MPDRRRPGLWKRLVAAARTARDRVADGLEGAADGLRSLGRDRAPAPPTDPRLTGVDPAIAAHVAALDPEWFSFDVSGGAPAPAWTGAGGALPPWGTSDEPEDATLPAEAPKQTTPGHSSSMTSQPPRRRTRPSRGEPTAAELPAGRPVAPTRISFLRVPRTGSHHESRGPQRGSTGGDSESKGFKPGVRAAGTIPVWSNAKRTGNSDPKDSGAATTEDVTGSSGAARSRSRTARPARERTEDRRTDHAKQDGQPQPRPAVQGHPAPERSMSSSSPAPAPPIAFSSRPGGVPASTEATQRSAPVRSPTREPNWPVPFLGPPTSSRHPPDRVEQITRSRPESPAPIAPPTRVSRSDSTVQATWPELPPSTWSASPPDSGGARAWAAASPADALVDEQRST